MTRHAPSWRAGAARVAGAVLAAALATGCGTAAVPSPSVTSPAPSPSAPAPADPTPSPGLEGSFTAKDVDRIVLGEADAPAGASYLGTDVGPGILMNPVWYLSSPEQQRFRALPGFIHASASSYRLGSSSADPLFVSEVMLFDDAESAAHAMAAYAEEWEASFGFADPTPSTVELGEEGLLFSGPAAVQNGEPGFYYFWRVNNLVLNMVGVGPVEGAELDVMETTVRAMALEMDRRAEAGVDDAEQVFPDFNAAIATGDEERAAGLLAEGGQIFHQDVTEASDDGILGGFSCIAEVLAVEGSGETVEGSGETVEVRLRFTGTRPGAVSECDVIGTEETVVVTARAGRIVSIDEP